VKLEYEPWKLVFCSLIFLVQIALAFILYFGPHVDWWIILLSCFIIYIYTGFLIYIVTSFNHMRLILLWLPLLWLE